MLISANEADKALSAALLTCESVNEANSQFSPYWSTTQPTGQQLNLLELNWTEPNIRIETISD